MTIFDQVEKKARSAKEASGMLYNCSTKKKNELLTALIRRLRGETNRILAANRKDLSNAQARGLSTVLTERLTLNKKRIEQLARGVEAVIRLPDPVGRIVDKTRRPNGLSIEKMRVPLGTVGIIYESRPNVTIDAASLCLKSGNSVLLRGGSEAINSNKKLVDVLKLALRDVGLPAGSVEFIATTDRRAVTAMLQQEQSLDVIIPRGSRQLISFIQKNSSVPVIAHGEGNCHIYVDRDADLTMAENVVFNAKVQRPSVCNAAEKLLVHKNAASGFLPRIANRLRQANVEIRGDRKTASLVNGVKPAKKADWYTEYLDLIIAIKVVNDLDEAIAHINRYGSHHSDAIVTRTRANGERFLREVDSAAVYFNASTRFTDGFEFGLGAEIGISTQKLHARGPMGLVELTSTKYIVHGKGQIRT